MVIFNNPLSYTPSSAPCCSQDVAEVGERQAGLCKQELWVFTETCANVCADGGEFQFGDSTTTKPPHTDPSLILQSLLPCQDR